MNLRSMTGFARVRRTIFDVDVVLSIKSVNHRGLDLHFYAGPELDGFEAAMRAAVKRHIGRGHVDIRVQLTQAGANASLTVDHGKLAAYVAQFRTAAATLGLTAEPDLNSALRVPGVLTDSSAMELTPAFEQPLIDLLEEALATLDQFRCREGAELGSVLLQRSASVAAAATQMEALRRETQPAFQARLRDKLLETIGSSAIDPQRLVQEAAILADRSDIGEEIERLKIHSRQLDDIVHGETEAGKKLDFVLQEMNREANTILSKTSGIAGGGLEITELALAVKSDVEKLREQVLNLE